MRSNARGQRTRQVIVDALLALVADGDLRPTVPRVAERAGLSLRSVFHHFNEVEVLLAAALERQWQRCASLPRSVPAGLPVHVRLERFVRQRARFFEDTMAIRRAVLLAEAQSPRLAQHLSAIHRHERDEALVALAGGTEVLSPGEQALAEAALAAASSFATWEWLRVRLGLTLDLASRAMQRMLAAQVAFAGR